MSIEDSYRKRHSQSVMKRNEYYQSQMSPQIKGNVGLSRNVYTSHSKGSFDSLNMSLPRLQYGNESQRKMYNDIVFESAKKSVDQIKLKLDLAENRRQIHVEEFTRRKNLAKESTSHKTEVR